MSVFQFQRWPAPFRGGHRQPGAAAQMGKPTAGLLRLACWLFAVLTLCLILPARGAQLSESQEEQQLILKLQSDASLKEKDAACARLKWIGTTRSVPALSA